MCPLLCQCRAISSCLVGLACVTGCTLRTALQSSATTEPSMLSAAIRRTLSATQSPLQPLRSAARPGVSWRLPDNKSQWQMHRAACHAYPPALDAIVIKSQLQTRMHQLLNPADVCGGTTCCPENTTCYSDASGTPQCCPAGKVACATKVSRTPALTLACAFCPSTLEEGYQRLHGKCAT